jgi:hypothetical protein
VTSILILSPHLCLGLPSDPFSFVFLSHITMHATRPI